MPPGYDELVAYAGPWCQVRWRAQRRPTQGELYAVLTVNRDGDDKVLAAAGGSATGARVVPLLERCWAAVHVVAGKLVAKGVISHADVCGALRLSADPATCAVQLAHIRAGSAPGSFTVSRPVSA